MGDLARLQQVAGSEEQRALGEPSQESRVPNQYCLAPSHDPRLLTDARFFWADPNDSSCPICPVCNKQVQAQALDYNAKGQPVIPRNLVALADRIGEAV